MILHQGDKYVCNETQVDPGSLNFLKPSLKIGVSSLITIHMISNFWKMKFYKRLAEISENIGVAYTPISNDDFKKFNEPGWTCVPLHTYLSPWCKIMQIQNF